MEAYISPTDTETTGFDSIRNQVITLSTFMVDKDYNVIGEHHGKFRPEGKKEIVWSVGAEEVHKISYDEAMTFPPIKQACEEYLQFLHKFQRSIMVAHNLPYDRRMLKGTFSRYDLHFDLYNAFSDYQDTVKLVKDSGLVSSKSKSLGAVCKELGIAHDHHDAKSDAFVLIEIHRLCNNRKGNNALISFSDTGLETLEETQHV